MDQQLIPMDTIVTNTFHKFIYEDQERILPCFTQQQMADILGVDRTRITKILKEDNNFNNVTLIHIVNNHIKGQRPTAYYALPLFIQISMLCTRSDVAKRLREVYAKYLTDLSSDGIAVTNSFATSLVNGEATAIKQLLQTCLKAIEDKEAAEKRAIEAEKARYYFNSEGGILGNKLKAKNKEIKELKSKLGEVDNYQTVTVAFGNVKNASQIGKTLSELSQSLGYEIHNVLDPRWGSVHSYHKDVIEIFKKNFKKQ